MVRRKTVIVHLVAYLLAIAGTLRYLGYLLSHPSRWAIFGLLAVFFVLLAIEPWLIRRSQRREHLYLAVQTCVLIALTFVTTIEDFAALPFASLILQAMDVFPPKIGFRWIGVFAAVVVVFMVVFGIGLHGISWVMGLLTVLIYATVYLLIGVFMAVIQQLEMARGESQELLAELQAAHQQLQIYTAQAEELAVVAERNRLARNLHDSVSQTIFSMTLTAEAARILFDRDAAQARRQLDSLQELAKSALAEMRSLVFELRPSAVAELGLIPALRHHIVTLERQHSLAVDLQVAGEPHLTKLAAQRLFRIVQEALNNVVKHAETDRASVGLLFEEGRALVQVEDQGRGFATEAIEPDKEHMGLSTMRERADMLGGTLTIDSRPGVGTRVTVEVTSASGEENHGQDQRPHRG